MDRSGRTYEEYRQLYWDEKARRKELQAQLADAEKTRIAIAHIRDKKSTEARHRYEAAEAQLDNRQKEHDLARNNWMKMYEDVKAQLDDRDMLYEAGITAARKEIEGLQAQLANYQKNWHCKCGGWSEPEMKHCQFCGGLRKDTWYAKRIEELQSQVDALNSPVLKSEWQEQQDRIEELEAQLDTALDHLDKEQEMYSELLVQLAESELRFEDADKQARKHFDLYNKAEAQVADMESEMDKAETAYNTAVSHNVILEAQLDAVTKLIEEYMKYNKHGRGCDCELHRIKALIGEIT